MNNMEYISAHLQCGEEEKTAACGAVRKLYRYALLARMYGILVLEEELAREDQPFLRDCLSRLVEAMDPERLQEYMTIRILAENVTGGPFLEMIVIADGVTQLQRMENPNALLRRLSAWFGSAFQERYAQETVPEDGQAQALIHENAGRDQKRRGRSVCPAFDTLVDYNIPALQRILQEVAPDELALALKAAGYPVYRCMAENLSEQRRRRLAEDMDALRNIRNSDAERAQKQILEIVDQLVENGEIIVNPI